ncbi:uncharacterized protein LOC120913905 isoform X2 [Rana temporaria]|uniref:uncharacterized protein LOC120913905 isoform X2 n=1 Tax=Rana temporaria TaxID=8407 RepID=UPI001AADE858|nr:uncharacterized protein LOC120913905 isoform X2 [Rana temporaria]
MNPVEDDENYYGLCLRSAVENDETASSMTSFPDLQISSSMTSFPDLQISSSFEQVFRWSRDVLEAFDKIPDFSPEQAEDLSLVFGFPLGSQPVCVRKCLEAFNNIPENQNQLRSLTKQLKRLGRADVVKAMHLQRGALCWLGPVLPEEMPIRDIVPSLWVPLTAALSAPHSHDWKWLARKVDLPPLYISSWQQKKNPADEVLTYWKVRNDATIGRLFDLLLEHQKDLAAML